MRACVISDIHGNLHALEAVLGAIDADAPDVVWCLGDLVGYGPRPNECCAIVRERAEPCLVGNHDLAVLGRVDLAEFQPDAAASARWTASVLEPDHRSFLESLDSAARLDDVGLYHASPRDPVWEYVLSTEVAAAAMAGVDEPIVLVGHSHVALVFLRAEDIVHGGLAPADTELDLTAAERWLLNPGSVGQPRDGDPRAAYMVIDTESRRAHFRRIPYAVERTQKEIRDNGLPEALAARLEHGL